MLGGLIYLEKCFFYPVEKLCVQGKSSVTLCRDFVYLVGGSYAKVLSKSHAYSVESCE